MNYLDSMTDVLVLQMLPAMGLAVAASLAWYALCRWICREQERAWYAAIRETPGVSGIPTAAEIAVAHAQLNIARRGSPADRLFFLGLSVGAAVVAISAMMKLWLVIFT